MKTRLSIIVACMILGLMLASCSSANKTCPAYSKVTVEKQNVVKS